MTRWRQDTMSLKCAIWMGNHQKREKEGDCIRRCTNPINYTTAWKTNIGWGSQKTMFWLVGVLFFMIITIIKPELCVGSLSGLFSFRGCRPASRCLAAVILKCFFFLIVAYIIWLRQTLGNVPVCNISSRSRWSVWVQEVNMPCDHQCLIKVTVFGKESVRLQNIQTSERSLSPYCSLHHSIVSPL